MKRLMMLFTVLSIGYVAGAALPHVTQAQGGQGREGGTNLFGERTERRSGLSLEL